MTTIKNILKNKMEDKKGASYQMKIIEIVLAIVGFGIILLVYWLIAAQNTIDRTTCSQSVIYRGTLFDEYGFTTKEIVSLKCRTRLVCISDKTKGECEFEGKKYETIEIDSSDDKIDNQIKMTLAREMADCWNMMGEGKVQIFSREYLQKSSKGVICSRIEFDKSIKEKKGTIQGFTQYLISHKVPGREESYWQYLTDGDSSNNIYLARGSKFADVDYLNLNEKAILFVELDKSYIGGFLTAVPSGILGAYGGAVIGKPIGAVIGTLVIPIPVVGTAVGTGVGFVVGAAAGGITLSYLGESAGETVQDYVQTQYNGADFISGQFLIDYSPEAIKSFKVDDLENTV